MLNVEKFNRTGNLEREAGTVNRLGWDKTRERAPTSGPSQ